MKLDFEAGAERDGGMKLDLHAKKYFTLHIPSGEADPKKLVAVHGLQPSATASRPGEAVLFTTEPYAAAPFFDIATPVAADALAPIYQRVMQSWGYGVEKFPVPDGCELWPFQCGSVRYVLDAFERGHGALVGDEPGLGKTEIALVVANAIGAQRVLVICPASIRRQWVDRARLWSTIPRPRFSIVVSGRHGIAPSSTHHFTVVSYDLARNNRIYAAILAQQYDLLILDESHYVKTSTTGRALAIFGEGGIATRAKHVLALSGTPEPNRATELFSVTKGLCWDAIDWMSEHAFGTRFNEKIATVTADGRPVVYNMIQRLPELRSRLRGNFMVRHLKRQVMSQLKMPIYDLVRVMETASVKAALKAEALSGIDPETLKSSDGLLFDGSVSTIRKEMGIAMAPQVADYAAMVLDGGEPKIVLFGWHIEVLDIYQKKLAKYGCVRIDGRTSAARKTQAVNDFIRDPGFRVIIGNVLTLGTGVDGLQQVCSHVMIGEPDWVPLQMVQCIDRLDRGGQTRTVQADIFVAPKSIAEKVLATALRKLQNINETLDGENP